MVRIGSHFLQSTERKGQKKRESREMAKILMDKAISSHYLLSNCIFNSSSISNTRTMANCSTFCPRLPTRFSCRPTSSFSPKPHFFLSFKTKAFSSQTPKGIVLFLHFELCSLFGHSLFPIWDVVRYYAQSHLYLLFVCWSVQNSIFM